MLVGVKTHGDDVQWTWRQHRHPSGWIEAYRVRVDDAGDELVAELRCYPDTNGDPGEWTRDPADVPGHGLTSPLLRSLKISNARGPAQDRDVLALVESLEWAVLLPAAMKRTGPGRQHRDREDLFYAAVSALYVHCHHRAQAESRRLPDGRRPSLYDDMGDILGRHVRRERDQTRGHLAVWVSQCRGQYLTNPPVGRAGGTLTAHAMDVLDAWQTEDEEPSISRRA